MHPDGAKTTSVLSPVDRLTLPPDQTVAEVGRALKRVGSERGASGWTGGKTTRTLQRRANKLEALFLEVCFRFSAIPRASRYSAPGCLCPSLYRP